MVNFLDEMSVCPTKPIDALPTTHMDIDYGLEMAGVTEFLSNIYPELEKLNPTIQLKPVLKRLVQENQKAFGKVMNPNDGLRTERETLK